MSNKDRAATAESQSGLQSRSASSRRRGAAPAQRLYETSFPIPGTLAETYLRSRGLTNLPDFASLRFQPHYYYRSAESAEAKAWPVLIAPVTNLGGEVTGVHRTWLSPHGKSTIPVDPAHQGLGDLLGNAVRFGTATEAMIAGMGIEATLSLRAARPDLPMIAGLTSDLLRAVAWPHSLRQLYIARDSHPGNAGAFDHLAERAISAGVAVEILVPRRADFNEDLKSFGLAHLRKTLTSQLPPEQGQGG